MAHAVPHCPIPVSCRESSRDASFTAGEIRCGPIADQRLVDEDMATKVGAMAPVAADARLDEVLSARDGSSQGRGLQVNAWHRIGGRRTRGNPFGAQRFQFRRTQ